MADYEITAPDGTVYEVTAPEGATEQEVMNYAQSQFKTPAKTLPVGQNIKEFVQGSPFKSLGFPGFLGQRIVPLLSKQTWQNVGHELTHWPTTPPQFGGLVDPRVMDIALAAGLLTTPSTPTSMATVLGKTPVLTPAQEVLQQAQQQGTGLVVPPSEINPLKPNVMESFAGKAPTRQKASQIDVPKINEMMRQEVGIAPGTRLRRNVLAAVRNKEGQAYQAVKDFPQPINATPEYLSGVQQLKGDVTETAKKFPNIFKDTGVDELVNDLSFNQITGQDAVNLSKKLRKLAKMNFKAVNGPNGAPPEIEELAAAQSNAADLIENLVTQNLTQKGYPELASNWERARTVIAKTHDIETALKANGNVDARVFARMLDKGKLLSGNLKLAGEFASQFPHAVQDITKAGSPEVSNLRALLSPMLGGTGAVMGSPLGPLGSAAGAVAGGILPFAVPRAARSILFQPWYQSRLIPQLKTIPSMFPVQRGLLATYGQERNGLLGER